MVLGQKSKVYGLVVRKLEKERAICSPGLLYDFFTQDKVSIDIGYHA